MVYDRRPGCDNLVISIKSSDVMMYRVAGKTPYPLHVGITEPHGSFW
ncbi:MAG: hypothetical protein ACLURV_13365 [Gallintestinimicrobium sp.]